MHDAQTTGRLSSWRDGAFLTTEAAGQIIGCGAGNVRELIFFGILKAVRHTPGGRLYVTVESVAAYIDRAEPVDPEKLPPLPKPRKRGRGKSPVIETARLPQRHLRLVVNNDRASL